MKQKSSKRQIVYAQQGLKVAHLPRMTYTIRQDGKILCSLKVGTGCPCAERATIKSYGNKLDWIIKDLLTSMPSHSADLLRAEIKNRDIASIDSILNMCIALSESDRLELEDYITNKYLNHGHGVAETVS